MNDKTPSPTGVETSLITVTYNSAATLRRFWSEFRPQNGVEWIVVDNASSDDTLKVAESLGARVVALADNRGFSAANNAGFRVAHGDTIGFVNPDVSVNVADLAAVSEYVTANECLYSPQLINPDGSPQANGRGFPLLAYKIGNRIGGNNPRYTIFGRHGRPTEVCWLMGAVVFGRRDLFENIGVWDDHFFLYYEDKDISLRAWRSGARVVVDPRIEWVHGWARETTAFRLTPWRREIASMTKFYRRYPEFLTTFHRAQKRHPEIAKHVYG